MPYTEKEITTSSKKIRLFSLLIFVFSSILFSITYLPLHGPKSYFDGINLFIFDRIYITIPILIIGIIVHELFHIIGFVLFCKVNITNLKVGFGSDYLSPFIHCKTPVTRKAYLVGLILPFVFVGCLPVIAGFLIGKFELVLFGIIFITAASSDLIIFFKLLRARGVDCVQDHPDKAGCIVL